MLNRKVCIVAPIHIWNDVRVFKKQATSLADCGYDVTLIASMEKCYDGVIENGVKLKKSKIADKGRLARVICFYQVLNQALQEKADIYHLHNPNTIPIAIILRLFSKKVIYDTHEDYSQRLLFRDWIPKYLRKVACYIVSKLEFFTSRFCSASIGTQESVVQRLGGNSHLIGNLPRYSEELIRKVELISNNNVPVTTDVFRLVYLGSINKSRGISDIVEALHSINKVQPTRLWLIGSIADTYLTQLKRINGWEYVDFTGPLEQDLAFGYVRKSKLGVICIHDVGDHRQTDPNKIYEYMTFGVPFIASDFPCWKNKLGKLNAGIFVTPSNSKAFANKVLDIIDDENSRVSMGINGNTYVSKNNWSTELNKLVKIYDMV